MPKVVIRRTNTQQTRLENEWDLLKGPVTRTSNWDCVDKSKKKKEYIRVLTGMDVPVRKEQLNQVRQSKPPTWP